jgi:glycosyltransferase involved in cell wall biosynthesis
MARGEMQVGKRSERSEGAAAGLRFSVIISTYNRARTLADCLVSLCAQTYAGFEVIVVVGPCTDATSEVVARHGRRIKLVDCPERNLAASRNRGIAQAAGDVCAFIDDDAVAHPHWLERLAAPYADPQVGGVGGFTIDNTGARFQCRYTLCDRLGNAVLLDHVDPAARLSQAGLWLFPSLLGTNSSFRRELLEEIGGFDEQFEYMLDETDVCLRLADRQRGVVTAPGALVFHRYAESHVRDHRRIARTLVAPSRSKAHFVFKHARARVADAALIGELDRFRADQRFSNRWHVDRELLEAGQFVRLNREIDVGLREGIASGVSAGPRPRLRRSGPPPRFLPMRERETAALAVALVSQGFPPGDTAGIARWTHELAHGLARRGHRVHVITTSPGARSINYDDGVWIHAVPSLHDRREPPPVDVPAGTAARAAAVLAEARAIRREFGLDILSAPIWDVEGLLCAAHLDLPVVTSLHTAYRMVLPMKPQWRFDLAYRFNHVQKVIDAETWLLGNSALLLANSHAVCRELAELYGVPVAGPRVAVVPHGVAVPDGRAGAADERAAAEPGACRILFVGRIEARKGLDLLLRALAPLLDAHPAAVLDVVGAPVAGESAFAELIAGLRADLAQAGHADRVRFHGHVAEAALLRCYAACDVFVVPSRFESFGLIAIEAMRFGKPVIAADVGGLVEIVEHGVCGLRFPGNSVEALRAALRTLLDDPRHRQRLGERAAQVFRAKFTSEIMAANVERALLAALARHRGGAVDAATVEQTPVAPETSPVVLAAQFAAQRAVAAQVAIPAAAAVAL